MPSLPSASFKPIPKKHSRVSKKKLETGKLKGKAATDIQAKITEKQNKLAELDTQSKAARITAEKDGTIAKLMVKMGQAVTAGTEAVSVADKGLVAELSIPAADGASLSAGQTVSLTNSGKTVSLKAVVKNVEKQDSQTVVTFSIPADASVKAGDELLAEKTKLEQVVSVPASAMQDGKILVVKDGKAAAVSVIVAAQDGDTVFLKGLTGGEQVISARTPELHEGVEVEVAR